MLCHCIDSASSNKTRPCKDWPAPVSTLMVSSACVLPMMPVMGAMTPFSEQF